MDTQDLYQLANSLSLQFWQKPLTIKVVWNTRLRSSAGRYIYSKAGPQRIEVSYQEYIDYGLAEVVNILKHELCHFHLHQQNKAFQDGSVVFKQECQRVGAQLTAKPRAVKYVQIFCSSCGQLLGYRQRIRKNLISSCCGSSLMRGKEVLITSQGEIT